VLTISGTGFGFLQGNSYVSVLSASDFHTYTTWPATSWSDTQIVVSVPNNMPLGKVYLIVEVNEQDSPGWNPFTVGIPPTISTYSPGYGDPGTELTIHGTGFGQSQGNSYVSVVSTPPDVWTRWTPTSWSDTQIVVQVPRTMPTGKVYLYVTVNHLDDIGTYPFTVGIPPTISTYSPGYGDPGTELNIYGAGFGASQGSSYVSAHSPIDIHTYTTWPATSWSDTHIVVPVPNNTPFGSVYLYVTVNHLDDIGTYPFTVGIPPMISTYSPGYGDPGTELTIHGTGFGASQGGSYVLVQSGVNNAFFGWPATNWRDTQITVPVPSNMPLGRVSLYVVVKGLESIGTFPFTVGIPPAIRTYSPGFGNAGTVVTINGTGFGSTQAGSYVLVQSGVNNAFFGWPATNWRDTQITVPVPTNMPLGRVSLYVVVNGLESIGTYPFTVGIPPAITGYSPTSGPTGTVLTINGNGFGPTQGSGYVTLQSVSNTWTALTATSWSDTQIVVTLPKLTPSGWNYLSVTADGLQSIGTYPFNVQ